MRPVAVVDVDLRHGVFAVIDHIHHGFQLTHPRILRGVIEPHEQDHVLIMRGRAFLHHGVQFQKVDLTARHTIMRFDVVIVVAVADVVDAPVFAVHKHDGWTIELRVEAKLLGDSLHEPIPKHGFSPILTRIPQQDASEIIQLFVWKEPIPEAVAAVVVSGVESEGFLPERTSPCAVHAHSGVLSEGGTSVVFKKLDVHGSLPLIAALREIGRCAAVFGRGGIQRAPLVIDFAQDIDAAFVIEQMQRIGDERDHRQRIAIGARRIDDVGMRENGCDPHCVHERRHTHHGRFEHLAFRWRPRRVGRAYVRNHGQRIRITDPAADGYRRSVQSGAMRRLGAVQRVTKHGLIGGRQREVEALCPETSAVGDEDGALGDERRRD